MSRISSKGQVTIPQEVRVRLGLRAGDEVEFADERGRIVLRPVRRANVFDKFAGALGTFPGGKAEINAWLDDLRSESPGR